jgi:hypothetical protein
MDCGLRPIPPSWSLRCRRSPCTPWTCRYCLQHRHLCFTNILGKAPRMGHLQVALLRRPHPLASASRVMVARTRSTCSISHPLLMDLPHPCINMSDEVAAIRGAPVYHHPKLCPARMTGIARGRRFHRIRSPAPPCPAVGLQCHQPRSCIRPRRGPPRRSPHPIRSSSSVLRQSSADTARGIRLRPPGDRRPYPRFLPPCPPFMSLR